MSSARKKTYRRLLSFALLSLSAISAQSASAGQWVFTGRVQLVDTESMQPYPVFWTNTCHGGVPGPSGVYTYGDWGPEGLGSCPSDSVTGWNQNIVGSYGQCRPDPDALGGGYSCVDYSHTINGQTFQGELPATCNVPGSYSINYRRVVQMIDYGVGTMPHDFYEQINESSAEYLCQ